MADTKPKATSKKDKRRSKEAADRVADRIKHVHIDSDAPRFTETFGDADVGSSVGLDNHLDLDKFKRNFSIQVP